MNKEFKNFELKSVNNPPKWETLCSTVSVWVEGKPHYCYISFSPKFIEYVGKKLPRGVSKLDPAYLVVVRDPAGGFTVYASYIPNGDGVKLWHAQTCPTWLKFHKVKVAKNGNSPQAQDPISSSLCGRRSQGETQPRATASAPGHRDPPGALPQAKAGGIRRKAPTPDAGK